MPVDRDLFAALERRWPVVPAVAAAFRRQWPIS
jgi:hypothetical protein